MDDCNREVPGIDVDFSLPALRIICGPARVSEWRGMPEVIRCDNGPECRDGDRQAWAAKRSSKIDYIQPGRAQQNAYVGRFVRTVRDEWIARCCFDSLAEIQDFARRWMWSCVLERPNMALAGITPNQRLAMAAQVSF